MKAVLVANCWDYIPSISYSYFDIIAILHSLIKLIRRKPIFAYIKGHQNNSVLVLDEWARINIIADSLAKLVV